jgi:hypothetical protein
MCEMSRLGIVYRRLLRRIQRGSLLHAAIPTAITIAITTIGQ